MKLALKIDVNTWRGALQGLPRLVETLRNHEAQASFFFALGPDHSGRVLQYAARPQRSSLITHYGLKTLLYGTLLPGPDIGKRCQEILRGVPDEGHEVGLQCGNRASWLNNIELADGLWTEREMRLAGERFQKIFETPPKAHAAPAWQMNAHALRLTQRLGFDYACDSRGAYPYMPVYQGEVIHCPQLPTTLPTLDELIGLDGLSADNVHEYLLELTREPPAAGHVYTLRAELDGMKLLPVFEKLLTGWREQGYTLTTTRAIFDSLDLAMLPRHEIVRGRLANPGSHRKHREKHTLMLQGEAFLDHWRLAAA